MSKGERGKTKNLPLPCRFSLDHYLHIAIMNLMNTTETIMVVAVRIFALNASGTKLLKTDKGNRTFAAGFVLSDGSFLVAKNGRCFSKWSVIEFGQNLVKNLNRGDIKRDLSKWDAYELDMYVRMEGPSLRDGIWGQAWLVRQRAEPEP